MRSSLTWSQICFNVRIHRLSSCDRFDMLWCFSIWYYQIPTSHDGNNFDSLSYNLYLVAWQQEGDLDWPGSCASQKLSHSRRQHLGQGKDLLFSFISRHVKMLWWRNLHSMLIPKHTHVEYTKSFSSFDWLAFDPFTFLFASLYKTQANFDWDLDSTHVTVKETSFLVCGNLWWVPSTNVSWWCDVSRQNVREKFSAQLFERTGHEFGHDVARLLWLE